jgi:hypothetical protein
MKKDVAKKWAKALRSGKFKQGKSWLKQYNSKGQVQHCCLGVLCELYNESMKKNHKKSLQTRSVDGVEANFVYFGNQSQGLPKVVREWSGVQTSLGDFDTSNDFLCLADLNDCGSKFKTIANLIEKNMENI